MPSAAISRWFSHHFCVQFTFHSTICSYIYRLTLIIHGILYCSKSSGDLERQISDKEESDWWNGLWLWDLECYKPLQWEYSTKFEISCSSVQRSKIWLFHKSKCRASWLHLHHCRCGQEHITMLLQHLQAQCSYTAGPGSSCNDLEALVQLTIVSSGLACGFWTILHFADIQLTSSTACSQATQILCRLIDP